MNDLDDLRTFLMVEHGTDFGVSDGVLVSIADEAKAYVEQLGYGSWKVVAARRLKRAAYPEPEDSSPGNFRELS